MADRLIYTTLIVHTIIKYTFNIHKNDDTGKLTINVYTTYNSRVDLSRKLTHNVNSTYNYKSMRVFSRNDLNT